MAARCAGAMTALGSWGEIGVAGETGAASDHIDLAVTSEAAPRSALTYGSERSIARWMRRSVANRARVSVSRAHRPESCASLAATMCSMSVSRAEANQVPVYGL